jgi:hypothetical protein
MHKTKIAGVTISMVKRTHAVLMYLWPFQSLRAVLHSVVVVTVGLSILELVMYLLAPKAMVAALIGWIIFYLVRFVYTLLPARLTLVSLGQARHVVSDVQDLLIMLGYVASEQPPMPGRFRFRSKHSPFWRWREQEVELLVSEHELVVTGPVTSLYWVRIRLLKREDFSYLDKKA